MVISRLTSGLANQIYEFCTGYALSRELNRELVLDISSTVGASRGYLLDYFDIPDCKKLLYRKLDVRHLSDIDYEGIPKWMLDDSVVLEQSDPNHNEVLYDNLNQAGDFTNCKYVILKGYFFTRSKYYAKYWNELREMFRLRVVPDEIKRFRKEREGRVSIGVHIRRGDMLHCDWATKMQDGYYRAMIVLCRFRYKNPIFFIFSDDIEYVKSMLGYDSTYRYVHFMGRDDADLYEFVALCEADYHIRSNSSTFSRLAHELSCNERTVSYVQGEECSLYRDVKRVVRAIFLGEREHSASTREINLLSKFYKTDGVRVSNLDDISNGVSGNISDLPIVKLKNLINRKYWGRAKLLAERIYNEFKKSEEFLGMYIEILKQCGEIRNAEILRKKKSRDIHVYIAPGEGYFASTNVLRFSEIGILLDRMGYDVTFLWRHYDEVEDIYVKQNNIYTNRESIILGGKQVLETNAIFPIGGGKTYVISRNYQLNNKLVEYNQNQDSRINVVFLDYTDITDPEYRAYLEKKEVRNKLIETSDIIVTSKGTKIENDNKKVCDGLEITPDSYHFQQNRIEFKDLHNFSCASYDIVEYLESEVLI